MDINGTTERVYNIIVHFNEEAPFILAQQLIQLLQSIEIHFGIILDAKYHQVINLFINQSNDIAINKQLVLEFLNDLLETNLANHINDLVHEQQSWNNEKDIEGHNILTSSPMEFKHESCSNDLKDTNNKNLFADDTVSFHRKELEKLDDHINSRISDLGTNSNSIPSQQSHTPSVNHLQFFSKFFTSMFHQITRILFSSNKIILISNSILISIISTIIILQNFTLSSFNFKIYSHIYKLFIYKTYSDLYWWQRLPFLEQKIWKLLDFIKFKDPVLSLRKP